jgi:hypothetical protein
MGEIVGEFAFVGAVAGFELIETDGATVPEPEGIPLGAVDDSSSISLLFPSPGPSEDPSTPEVGSEAMGEPEPEPEAVGMPGPGVLSETGVLDDDGARVGLGMAEVGRGTGETCGVGGGPEGVFSTTTGLGVGSVTPPGKLPPVGLSTGDNVVIAPSSGGANEGALMES